MNVGFPGGGIRPRLACGVLDRDRRVDRRGRRHARLLPLQALAVDWAAHMDGPAPTYLRGMEADRVIRVNSLSLVEASHDETALGAVAPRVHPARRRARRLRLLPGAAGPDEELLVVHRGETAFVLLNRFPYASGHVMVAPYRHVGDFGGLDDAEALEAHRLAAQGMAGARRGVLARGLQRRLEPRPGRRRRDRRPRPPARRPALVGRHELHAGARRREGPARAPGRDAREARRRLAYG